MHLIADRDIRKLLKLSDAGIARVIGKTRQAVNLGLEKSDSYFRPHEWTLLVLFLKSQEHPSLDILYKYLEKKYADQEGVFNNIISGLGNFKDHLEGISTKNVFCIIADYRHFKNSNPRSLQVILELAHSRDINLQFYTSTSTEKYIFEEDLLNSDAEFQTNTKKNITTGWIPEANQYPYFLCYDPGTPVEKYFVCISDKFCALDKIRGQTMFYYAHKSTEGLAEDQKHELFIKRAA